MEVTKAYLARQADEISLQQADVVLVLQQEDGERGAGAGGPGVRGRRGPGRLGAPVGVCSAASWPQPPPEGELTSLPPNLPRGHLQMPLRGGIKSSLS